MAPKQAAATAVFLRTERVKLADLSLAGDSGWRDLDESRVGQLEEVLYRGDFGNTTLAKPSVLCDQSDKAPLLPYPPHPPAPPCFLVLGFFVGLGRGLWGIRASQYLLMRRRC